MIKRKHRLFAHRFITFCVLSLIACQPCYGLNYEDWQKSTPETIYRLQCSLKCASEFARSETNSSANRDPITRCEHSIQSGCSECIANCRRIVPRLLQSHRSSPSSAGNLVNDLSDCGCASVAANSTAAASSANINNKVAPTVSSSSTKQSSLPRQGEESRRNTTRLLCERVCSWVSEMIKIGRVHSGSCPAPSQNNGLLVASKLSVRSPPQHDEYGMGNGLRSDELVEPLMNDQAELARSGELLNGPFWRASSGRLVAVSQMQSGCGYKVCNSDAECDWSEKCCSSPECMTRVCLPATIEEDGVDSFKIVSFSLDSDNRAAKFNWVPPLSHQASPSSATTLFLLELKYLIVPSSSSSESDQTLNEQSREDRMSDWMVVANATQMTSIHLDPSVIWPSTWYRFRVIRLSSSAKVAVSQPVGPVKIAKELRELTEPRNITANPDQWFLNADDPESVDGTISWLPPLVSDVPVTRYKVFYTQYVPSNVLAILSSPPEFKKSVPGHVTTLQLEQLIPETTYRVDIQAITRLPSIKLRSSKATVYIRTVALDEAGDPPGALRRSTVSLPNNGGSLMGGMPKSYDVSAEQSDSYSLTGSNEAFKLPPPVDGLNVGEVILSGESGRLEVVVSWSAPVRPTFTPLPSTGFGGIFGEANAEIFSDDEDDSAGNLQSGTQSGSKNQSPLRYIVEWAPLSCIQQEPSADSSSQFGMSQVIRRLSLVTMNTSVTLHTLLPTCFYEVSVTTLDPSNGLRGPKQTQSFRTPLCSTASSGPCNGESASPTSTTTTKAPPRTVPTTHRPMLIDNNNRQQQSSDSFASSGEVSSSSSSGLPTPAPVHNLQFKPVADNGSILVQWESAPASPLLTPVELVFSWSVYPSLEPAPGQVRRLSPNRSRVIMQNLKPGLLYVVSVVSVARRQSDGELMKSPPARIVVLLATPTPSPAGVVDSNIVQSKQASEQRSSSMAAADQLSSRAPSAASTSLRLNQTSLISLLLLTLLSCFSVDVR